MVIIPAGTIAMRDDRTGRAWVVELPSFAIGRYPVSQAEYAAVSGAWPASHDSPHSPVENVSWIDAVRFCNMLSATAGLSACYELHEDSATRIPGSDGYRLPSEAEWEYACRAGTNEAVWRRTAAVAIPRTPSTISDSGSPDRRRKKRARFYPGPQNNNR